MNDYKLLIDGQLMSGDQVMDVLNPATEQVLAVCPRGSEAQIKAAIEAAHRAFPVWRAVALDERRSLIMRLADLVKRDAEGLAQLLTQEQGKPIAEARAEAAYTEFWLRHLGGLTLEPKLIEDSQSRRVELHRAPLGVVAAIIPWNFPLLVVAFKLPLALLAGNTLVVKPAATTPLSTLRLGELCREIFPPGVVNVVTDHNDLGPVLRPVLIAELRKRQPPLVLHRVLRHRDLLKQCSDRRSGVAHGVSHLPRSAESSC